MAKKKSVAKKPKDGISSEDLKRAVARVRQTELGISKAEYHAMGKEIGVRFALELATGAQIKDILDEPPGDGEFLSDYSKRLASSGETAILLDSFVKKSIPSDADIESYMLTSGVFDGLFDAAKAIAKELGWESKSVD